ncbi:ThuA domain-containing protein [Planctomycetota bacterium]
MKRREMLLTGGAAVLGLSTFPFGWAAAADKKKQKVLYFTRSVQFEHSVVKREGDKLSHSEKILTELGAKAGFDVECSKDGRLFDGDLDQYDAIAFYTCSDLTQPSIDKAPPMSAEGKKRLVAAVAAGKPFVGIHSACYWGPAAGPNDPYLKMVGAEFITHGQQQESTMVVTSPTFPGVHGLGPSFRLLDEWYAMKDFAQDMHVILAQDGKGMEGAMYQRPPFPSSWARRHGKGRVFFTAMGHREDVWTNATFQQILLGGIAWALGNVDAEIPPNISKTTPQAGQLPS